MFGTLEWELIRRWALINFLPFQQVVSLFCNYRNIEYRIFSIKRPRRLFQTRPGGPGVYLKPAFNRGPAFINDAKLSIIFQFDLLLPILRYLGPVCQGETIFASSLPKQN